MRLLVFALSCSLSRVLSLSLSLSLDVLHILHFPHPFPLLSSWDHLSYGKNKIEWLHHLRWLRWRFFVLPKGAFVVHVPHPKSKANGAWRVKASGQKGANEALYKQWVSQLRADHYHEKDTPPTLDASHCTGEEVRAFT